MKENSKKEKFTRNKEEKDMDIIKPYNVKFLEDERVVKYLKEAVKCKSVDEITAELNKSLAKRAKKVTPGEVCQYYVELQRTSENGVSKEQLKGMARNYLENEKALKCNDYTWLREHTYVLVDMLYRVRERTAYNLSAEIFRKYNKVIPTRCIRKHFKNIGIDLPFGSKEKAIQRCGSHYKKRLERVDRKATNNKKGVN